MSDLIDRQAAIDALKNRWKKTRNYEGNGDDIAEECELYLKQVPSAQPETYEDAVSRNAIIQKLNTMDRYVSEELILCDTDKKFPKNEVFIVDDVYEEIVENLPSAQPEIIRCKDCIYYDPPHVEKYNGVRYEYDEMPADAFDALGTGLVSAEYGINVGGRCCVDYYCKNYSDDKRVFVREDNYCGRAERRTDGN